MTKKPNKKKVDAIPAKFQAGFLTILDGRTELAKGLKARFDTIAVDLGGIDKLSQVKAVLLERFVWLEASIRDMEATLADGKADVKTHSEIHGRWTAACNTLLGYSKTLGLDKKYQDKPWLDATS